MKKALITAGAVLVLAGCGSAAATHDPPAKPKPVATMSCQAQFNLWKTPGIADLTKLEGDLTAVATAAGSLDLGAAQGAGTKMASDATTILHGPNLPPTCVPGLRTDYVTMLNDFIAAGNSANQGTVTGLSDADRQIRAGSAAIKRSTVDLANFMAS